MDGEFLEYNMNHRSRGKCIIFAHDTFEKHLKLEPRKCVDKDVERLRSTFGDKLNFTINEYTNLKNAEISRQLRNIEKQDYSDCDALVVIISTHGDENGLIYSNDYKMSVKTFFESFSGTYCKSLVGKPKLFFIQACRGRNTSSGIQTTCDRFNPNITVHPEADYFSFYSTIDGYYSFNRDQVGSWFIQSLCNVLDQLSNKNNLDLLSAMTQVNYKVMTEYKSRSDKEELNNKIQASCFYSSLTKSLRFFSPIN